MTTKQYIKKNNFDGVPAEIISALERQAEIALADAKTRREQDAMEQDAKIMSDTINDDTIADAIIDSIVAGKIII